MASDGPGAPDGSSFKLLLASLAAEHDKEVRALRTETSRLAEALAAAGQFGCDSEPVLQRFREERSKLQAALKAAEFERDQLRSDLAARRGSVLLTPLGGRSVQLPGCVEVAPPEGGASPAPPRARAVHLDPTSTFGSGSPSAEASSLRNVASLADAGLEPGKATAVTSDDRVRSSGSDSTGSSSLSQDEAEDLESKIEKIALDEKVRQMERLVEVFQFDYMDMDDEVLMLPFDRLERGLKEKGAVMSRDRLQAVLFEICRVVNMLRDPEEPRARIDTSSSTKDIEAVDLEMLVDLTVDWNIMSRVEDSFKDDVDLIKDVLVTQDVEEVIRKVTRLRRGAFEHAGAEDHAQGIDRMLLRMNIVVSVAVMLSIMSLGASMDYARTSAWWIVLEGLIGAVFVGEVIIKCWIFGVGVYFCGAQRVGNLFDFTITLVAILDVTISSVTHVLQYVDADQMSAARISLLLRCVRLARIARLIKLLKAPCMRELANMLSGFFIGIPSLFWVMVMLGFVIYVLALALKSAVGPDPDQDLLSQCGFGDDPDSWPADNPDCQACKLYAEEFLYNVPASMFVVFRCVVGDCTTTSGQSLSAHMSRCYLWRFDVLYFLGMVAVIFGLFNVITAIFVQATMDGLSFSNAQNKFARMYESHHMRRKLEALVDRIEAICDHERQTESRTFATTLGALKFESRIPGSSRRNDILLSEALFYKVIQDEMVSAILEDLDVKLDHRVNTFHLFDLSNDGRVSLVELIQTLMKMRGEPLKSDLVASWAMLEELRNQFQEYQKTTLNHQKEVFDNQQDILRAMQGRASDRRSTSSPRSDTSDHAAARHASRPVTTPA